MAQKEVLEVLRMFSNTWMNNKEITKAANELGLDQSQAAIKESCNKLFKDGHLKKRLLKQFGGRFIAYYKLNKQDGENNL